MDGWIRDNTAAQRGGNDVADGDTEAEPAVEDSNSDQVEGDLSNVQAVVRVMQITVESGLADTTLEMNRETTCRPSIWVVLWPSRRRHHRHIQVRAVAELLSMVV